MSGEQPAGQTSKPIDVEPSTSPKSRIRTQSECSTNSDDEASSAGRQRTTSQTFMVTTLTGASPPKFVTLQEIMQASNAMKDMTLVHEIAVDKEFRLKRYEPEGNSLHGAVKDTMKRAYWDIFREHMRREPPDYSHAMVLFEEVKRGLIGLLLPQHTKLKQQITDVLDSEIIKQQIDWGTLDFKHYAQYVISVMAKLCAPIRDEQIQKISEMTDVVDTFCLILETLDLMALDMANFTLQFAKPDIIAHSIEVERKKFADLLAIQPDGLELTRNWLLRHLDVSVAPEPNMDRATYVRNQMKNTLQNAMIEILEWNLAEPYPETFVLDESRLQFLRLQSEKAIFMGTILLIVMSNVGHHLNTLASFKAAVKEHLIIIVQPLQLPSELDDVLPNISVQVVKDIQDAQKEIGMTAISDADAQLLSNLILDVKTEDHKIKELVRKRIKEFFREIIISCTADPQKVPSGLSSFQHELTAIAGHYLRVISHNTTVFCTFYSDIIDQALPTTIDVDSFLS